MNTGTVKFFNDTKGYGFIKEDESGKEYFVHVSGLVDEINENDKVLITGNTTITGTLHVTGAQTNDSTIVATDSITGKEITLDTHVHTGDSGGKTGTPE